MGDEIDASGGGLGVSAFICFLSFFDAVPNICSVSDAPSLVMTSIAWAAAALPCIPPAVASSDDWVSVLRYLAPFPFICRVVHCSLRQLCAAMRFHRPPPLPLRIYPAPGPAPASASARACTVTPAQLRQLQCIAGHLRLFIQAVMPRDVTQNRVAGEVLLWQVASHSAAVRMLARYNDELYNDGS